MHAAIIGKEQRYDGSKPRAGVRFTNTSIPDVGGKPDAATGRLLPNCYCPSVFIPGWVIAEIASLAEVVVALRGIAKVTLLLQR